MTKTATKTNSSPPPNTNRATPSAATATAVAKKLRVDRRLKSLLKPLPDLPPLSRPIQYLEDDGKLKTGKHFFTAVEPETDWNDAGSLKRLYKPFSHLGSRAVPACLLLSAATGRDKLIVLNWWRFQSTEEQKRHLTELGKIYAYPRQSNRLLPPDYWEKIASYKPKPKAAPLEARKPPPPPPGGDEQQQSPPLLERAQKCRGWSGGKYEPILRSSVRHLGDTISMKQGPNLLSTSIPVSFSKTGADLHFVVEGDEYVLRSRQCTGTVELTVKEGKTPSFFSKKLCPACRACSDKVCDMLMKISEKQAKQELRQEAAEKAKSDLRKALKREQTLRSRLDHEKEKAKKRKKGGRGGDSPPRKLRWDDEQQEHGESYHV
jgi:hypothetical protein